MGTHADSETIAREVYGLSEPAVIKKKVARLSRLAAAGKIPGAFQEGRRWFYPWAFFTSQTPRKTDYRMTPWLRRELAT